MRSKQLRWFWNPLSLVAMAVAAVGIPTLVQATPDGSEFEPQRVLDTRLGIGGERGRIEPGSVRRLEIPPATEGGATSVVLNLVATEALGSGWVRAWDCAEAQPATAVLNFAALGSTSNAVVIKFSVSGICLATSRPVHLVVDLAGWFTGADDFVGSTPNRLVDTRLTGQPLRAGEERRLTVAGAPGIAADASFAALNIAVDAPAQAGWIVAHPCGEPSNGATVNFDAGEVIANMTFVGLTDGEVCLRSLVTAHVVVDTYGWSTGSGAVSVQSPSRVLDTRDARTWSRGGVSDGDRVRLPIAGLAGVPSDAAAAILTVSVVASGGDGYVTAWSCDEAKPAVSTINFTTGQLRSNLAVVKLSSAGEICLEMFTSKRASADLVIDAVGWRKRPAVPVAPGEPSAPTVPGPKPTTKGATKPTTKATTKPTGAPATTPATATPTTPATVPATPPPATTPATVPATPPPTTPTTTPATTPLAPGSVPNPASPVWSSLTVVNEHRAITSGTVDISNTWFKGGLLIDTGARVTGSNVRIDSGDPESGDAAFVARGHVRLSNVWVTHCSEGMRWARGDLEISGLRIDCAVMPAGPDPHTDAFQVWPEGGGRFVLRDFLFDSTFPNNPTFRPNGSQIESAGRTDLSATFINGTIVSGRAYYGLRIYQHAAPNSVRIENVQSDTPTIIQNGANVVIAGSNSPFKYVS